MSKWRRKFAWQMAGFAILLTLMAGAMVFQTWSFRAKVIANPARFALPTLEMLFAAGVAVAAAVMCLSVIFSTRRHEARMTAMEKNRSPLTLAGLRDELRPEKQAQSRRMLLQALKAFPEARSFIKTSMDQQAEQYRTELGSTPEVEAELTRLRAFNESLLEELKAHP